jgi:hypothetical protein
MIMLGITPEKLLELKTLIAGLRIHSLESFDNGPSDH